MFIHAAPSKAAREIYEKSNQFLQKEGEGGKYRGIEERKSGIRRTGGWSCMTLPKGSEEIIIFQKEEGGKYKKLKEEGRMQKKMHKGRDMKEEMYEREEL